MLAQIIQPSVKQFRPLVAIARYSKYLTPLKQYDLEVSAKKIRNDDFQRQVLTNLGNVNANLQKFQPQTALISKLKRVFSIPEQGPKGIYLYGDVGCGKTMLMDMFYKTTPSHLTKNRVHFHAFMQEIHMLNHKTGDIPQICHHIATKSQVLCLDEVAVVDVADAMLLKKVWEELYRRGVVLFMTSNRHPDELYLNGIQRQAFLKAIGLIKDKNHIICLDSPTDYRKLPLPSSGNYMFGKSSLERQQHIDKWTQFLSEGNQLQVNSDCEVWGRQITIPQSYGTSLMKFSFKELCGVPLAAADYLFLSKKYKSVIITDIPVLGLNEKDQLRRFITFLDAAYDNHMHIALTAAKEFHKLLQVDHVKISKEGKVTFQLPSEGGSAGIGSGHEEVFAYARALSRLQQMSTQKWFGK